MQPKSTVNVRLCLARHVPHSIFNNVRVKLVVGVLQQSFQVFILLYTLSRRIDPSTMSVGLGMDLSIMHDSDHYKFMRDIGSKNFV